MAFLMFCDLDFELKIFDDYFGKHFSVCQTNRIKNSMKMK
jgi:hypothetical protein